jgi:hypothetical protein
VGETGDGYAAQTLGRAARTRIETRALSAGEVQERLITDAFHDYLEEKEDDPDYRDKRRIVSTFTASSSAGTMPRTSVSE